MRGLRVSLSRLEGSALESDVMNDTDTNQGCKRKANSDGEQIHIDGQPVAVLGLVRAGCFRGCHKSP